MNVIQALFQDELLSAISQKMPVYEHALQLKV